ncbi:4-carboxy-4-hydroxy-2-oxoadipate aldolase/oxaloacetate decarboxylase [Primorskyibacter flagellatus]|uniref:4-carboxy-4-hydroxy-2-oxoadipate aldolase/oxaloacetate decarboxylase n=1 Tax=Primorskyibacter flagellatus TaxID=1387277 RepID=UPI003A8F431D
MTHIIRNIVRPSPEQQKMAAEFPPATLHEAQARRGAIDHSIRPIYNGMTVCGPAVTVTCAPGDNLMLIAALDVCQPGDVLVVSAGGLREQGGFGEVLSTACMAKGIAGLVIDACVRDGEAIHKLGFPVFATGLAMQGTVKETLGTVNAPIVLGGIYIEPGDIISGDDDGLVVVRKDDIEETCRESRTRDNKEAVMMHKLREGANMLELTGLRSVLEKKGCVWE